MSAAGTRRAILALASALASAAAAQAPAPAAAPPVAKARNPDKVICRTTTQIGSLVATDKVCKPRREWDREHDNLRERGPVGNCPGSARGGSCA